MGTSGCLDTFNYIGRRSNLRRQVKELFEHLLLRGGSRNLSVEDLRAEPSRPKSFE